MVVCVSVCLKLVLNFPPSDFNSMPIKWTLFAYIIRCIFQKCQGSGNLQEVSSSLNCWCIGKNALLFCLVRFQLPCNSPAEDYVSFQFCLALI